MQKFDRSKLRGRIVEKFGTLMAFAEAMGVSRSTMSTKMGDEGAWSLADICRACELLEIPPEEIHLYFFVPVLR